MTEFIATLETGYNKVGFLQAITPFPLPQIIAEHRTRILLDGPEPLILSWKRLIDYAMSRWARKYSGATWHWTIEPLLEAPQEIFDDRIELRYAPRFEMDTWILRPNQEDQLLFHIFQSLGGLPVFIGDWVIPPSYWCDHVLYLFSMWYQPHRLWLNPRHAIQLTYVPERAVELLRPTPLPLIFSEAREPYSLIGIGYRRARNMANSDVILLTRVRTRNRSYSYYGNVTRVTELHEQDSDLDSQISVVPNSQ